MTQRFRDGATRAQPGRTALLLVNLGTPSAATPRAVRRYLGQFLHDYRVVDMTRWLWCPLLHGVILPLRARKVARNYARVWTPAGSPLLALSRALTQALAAQLPELEVCLAMRYGEPSIAAALRSLDDRGVDRVLVLPLYPQYSASTTASVFDAVMAELTQWRHVPALRWVNDYHLDEGWLDALEASVETFWDLHGRGETLLMSFHGLPERFIRAGDPYQRQCEAGGRALAQRLGLPDDAWQLTYQSRFGREPWLGPATDATLVALAARGVKTVDMVCPGFAVDCLETLEENAIQNAETFRAAGGSALRYIHALNAEPAHVAALAALARRHTQGWPH
jgi:protoporphyrin/coproporphyrin ferrochelatase